MNRTEPEFKPEFKVYAEYRIRYTEETFPEHFFDDDENVIATNDEIRHWAREQYATDITDITLNNEFYAEDVNVRINKQHIDIPIKIDG